MKMKRIPALFVALLLCAVLALPGLAAMYPAGINESLPRVVDEAGLLTQAQIDALEVQARGIIEQHGMDLIILTKRGLDGKTPAVYAEDFFDYEGYGWREEETDDITTGNGMILLLNMVGPGENDIEIATKGTGQSVFRDGVWEQLIDDIVPDLIDMRYAQALELFLDEAQARLEEYTAGTGIYEDPDEPYNQGHYDDEGNYVYDGDYGYGRDDSGGGVRFNGTIFVIALLAGLLIAWAVVASMKKKHNTIRIAAAAQTYQQRFDLTDRQDIFLYSNTTRVRIPEPSTTSGGGGGFSGGGSRTSSSGSSFGGGGRKF